MTTPEPTVLPPSRIGKWSPSLIAIGSPSTFAQFSEPFEPVRGELFCFLRRGGVFRFVTVSGPNCQRERDQPCKQPSHEVLQCVRRSSISVALRRLCQRSHHRSKRVPRCFSDRSTHRTVSATVQPTARSRAGNRNHTDNRQACLGNLSRPPTAATMSSVFSNRPLFQI